ncbi:LPS export ABC transporter periplasmic protein LptC [Sagittula sp. S175]|uniref:LPS export ABC transporter periplasmic protein LptC n=1 Tax=Sagittula sp. S175 TaxID=3415129 RepID=UPI003C7B6231
MARGDGLYSRVIAWLKILLPLAALGLLSMLFLLSDSRDDLDSMPFADALQQGETATPGVSSPYYSGTTSSGDVLTMTARRARPLDGGDVEADALRARLLLKDGAAIDLDAVQATMRDGERRIYLDGGVNINNSQGYTLVTEAMVSALDRVEAVSDGAVTGDGPLGHLEAGKMEIRPEGDEGDVQMLFTQGVKMIYQPPDKDIEE